MSCLKQIAVVGDILLAHLRALPNTHGLLVPPGYQALRASIPIAPKYRDCLKNIGTRNEWASLWLPAHPPILSVKLFEIWPCATPGTSESSSKVHRGEPCVHRLPGHAGYTFRSFPGNRLRKASVANMEWTRPSLKGRRRKGSLGRANASHFKLSVAKMFTTLLPNGQILSWDPQANHEEPVKATFPMAANVFEADFRHLLNGCLSILRMVVW